MFSELTNSLYFSYVKLISLGGSFIFCLLTSFCLFPFHWLKLNFLFLFFAVWYLLSMNKDVDKGIPFQLCYKQHEELLKGNPDSWFYLKKHQLKSKSIKKWWLWIQENNFLLPREHWKLDEEEEIPHAFLSLLCCQSYLTCLFNVTSLIPNLFMVCI